MSIHHCVGMREETTVVRDPLAVDAFTLIPLNVFKPVRSEILAARSEFESEHRR